jgi:hypothetical protein
MHANSGWAPPDSYQMPLQPHAIAERSCKATKPRMPFPAKALVAVGFTTEMTASQMSSAMPPAGLVYPAHVSHYMLS